MHPPVSSDAPTLAATPSAPPPQSAPPQPTYVVPQPKQGLPAWAVVLLVAVVLIGAGWAGITYLRPSAGSSATAPTTETKMATPGETPKAAHPFAKHLEITGLRILETPKQKLQIQMIVVNHSAADLPDLNLEVRLRSSKADPSAEPVTSFNVRVPSVAGYESKEVKAEASTKLRAYEFPDWQFLRAEFDVKEQ